MAELISAKDLPLTEAEEVDVLCVDNGELKRKPANGLGGGAGGYVIKVPLSDVTFDEETGVPLINLTESYDNFMPIAYAGGNVVLDMNAVALAQGLPEGSCILALITTHNFVPGEGYQGTSTIMGEQVVVNAPNGTWTPPTE